MRLVYRFIVLAIFVISTIVLLSQSRPVTWVLKFKGQIPRRIVSFGDSYSNNPTLQFSELHSSGQSFRILGERNFVPAPAQTWDGIQKSKSELTGSTNGGNRPPGGSGVAPASIPRLVYAGSADARKKPEEIFPDIHTPTVWTSLLCHKELACDVHDNFAVPNRVGVDKQVYLNNVTEMDYGSDLKDQVQKWLEYEDFQTTQGHKEKGETLFTVWFGISDIMKFSLLKRRDAIAATEKSLEVLFEQLEIIVKHRIAKTRILLPYVIDVTLLPAFSPLLSSVASHDYITASDIQKNAIFLTTLWNQGLEIRARQWEQNSQLILWDVNTWFLSEIRAGTELQEIEDTVHMGKFRKAKSARDDTTKKGGWKNVKEPCVGKRKGRWGLCDHPDSYLMWDEFRLGARAHRRIAKQAMKLIKDLWPTTENWIHPPSTKDIRDFWQGGGGVM